MEHQVHVPGNWPIVRHPRRINPSLPPAHAVPRRHPEECRDEPLPEDLYDDSGLEYTGKGIQAMCSQGLKYYDKPEELDQFDRVARNLTEALRLDYADCAGDQFKIQGQLEFRARARQVMLVCCICSGQ